MSPFITAAPLELAQSVWSERRVANKIAVTVVTNLSPDNLLQGALDAHALLTFTRSIPNSAIVYLPSVHAKVYIADERTAIVTSANLTDGGLFRNHEYGVQLTNRSLVKRVKDDIERFAGLGNIVTRDALGELARAALELRELRNRAERNLRQKFRKELQLRLRKTKIDLMTVRARGKTTHRIFADTILYLLERSPLGTVQLHPEIQRIHPDLCDDSVDRVIDGVHFGKKWKHYVRNAQQHLKRLGVIDFDRVRWFQTAKSAAAGDLQ